MNRANSKLLRAEDRQTILEQFAMPCAKPLAVGTESEVYERDHKSVLKLYADTSRLPYLETLRDLYHGLASAKVEIPLPTIQQIVPYGSLIVVVETRLEGVPLESLLPDLEGLALEQAETLYLDAVWKLKELETPVKPLHYLLQGDCI